jgi:hypothetical protein
MKRVISTKVDQTKHAEFLEYCARVNKYPANAMRDALDLLLVKGSDNLAVNTKPKTEKIEPPPKLEVKPKPEIDEEEDELE